MNLYRNDKIANMKENPFTPQETEEGRIRSERLTLEAQILTEVARDHTDELLSAEDWKKFGLDKVNPIDLTDFEWSVYVGGKQNEKTVGVVILDENGIYDAREFDVLDTTLPLSTKRQEIDEIIRKRVEKSRVAHDKTRAEHVAHMDQERGFPEGRYVLQVTYPHRSGTMKTVTIHNLDVETKTTKDEALQNARSWIQMHGLHNFGLDFSKDTGRSARIRIHARLKKDDMEVPFECSVDASGFVSPS